MPSALSDLRCGWSQWPNARVLSTSIFWREWSPVRARAAEMPAQALHGAAGDRIAVEVGPASCLPLLGIVGRRGVCIRSWPPRRRWGTPIDRCTQKPVIGGGLGSRFDGPDYDYTTFPRWCACQPDCGTGGHSQVGPTFCCSPRALADAGL